MEPLEELLSFAYAKRHFLVPSVTRNTVVQAINHRNYSSGVTPIAETWGIQSVKMGTNEERVNG